jgi:hypothetical protein
MQTFHAAHRASILIESMRDIGYSLETAFADIIDDSITAGASNIDLLTEEKESETQRAAIRNQRVLNGMEAQVAFVQAGGALWREVRELGASRRLLSEREISILSAARSIPARLPTEKQCTAIIETFRILTEEGCPIELNEII